MKFALFVLVCLGLAACSNPTSNQRSVRINMQIDFVSDAIAIRALASHDLGEAVACTYPNGSPLPSASRTEPTEPQLEWAQMMTSVYAQITLSDLSVTNVALRESKTRMMTIACSPNDVFWTHLSLIGWAQQVDTPFLPDTPEAFREKFRAYEFTEFGRKMMPKLLRALFGQKYRNRLGS